MRDPSTQPTPLDDLVPLVDPGHDPLLNLSACEDILLGEGWSQAAVGEWLRAAVCLSGKCLRLQVGGRRN